MFFERKNKQKFFENLIEIKSEKVSEIMMQKYICNTCNKLSKFYKCFIAE